MIKLDKVELTLTSLAGPVQILRGIDLQVASGSTLSVVGPSGSGKSSLLSIIGGIERPTSGTVMVGGTDLADLDEDELAILRREKIGILFQSFHLVPTMTAEENVALPLDLAGKRGGVQRARDLLADVGLAARIDHFPGQLSGGEQQRVALARALANEPALLLADEPTGNLDGTTGAEIIDLLFTKAAEQGHTVVLITHDPDLASRCDTTVRMDNGRIVEDRKGAARLAAIEALA